MLTRLNFKNGNRLSIFYGNYVLSLKVKRGRRVYYTLVASSNSIKELNFLLNTLKRENECYVEIKDYFDILRWNSNIKKWEVLYKKEKPVNNIYY